MTKPNPQSKSMNICLEIRPKWALRLKGCFPLGLKGRKVPELFDPGCFLVKLLYIDIITCVYIYIYTHICVYICVYI